MLHLYLCRFGEECGHAPYKYKAHRDNHLLAKHDFDMAQFEEQQAADKALEDHKQAYMKASLTFNLLFRVIND